MSLKSFLAKPFARWSVARNKKYIDWPVESQEAVFQRLISKAKDTAFGRDHDFKSIRTYNDFVNRVPVRDYEALKPYVERIMSGEKNVLWPGSPAYLAKTSGTTSGAKYIPITAESMKEQVISSKLALLQYIVNKGSADYVNGKMIFLQGSPVLDTTGAVKMGRLSGISAHYLPRYLLKNRLPSWETNIIEDWETKVEAIVDETIDQNMTLIAGIPSWVQMYFERLVARSGKKVGELFPSFSLYVYGGVNYEPYRQKFEDLLGRRIDSVELFPASEGFFAYQDTIENNGLLLQVHSGIFYEFIEASKFYDDNPPRISLAGVELGVDYALILSTNAGLWGYNIGDTVRFVSLKPYRVIVSGRIKHFISAFGEHVIAKEVEEAITTALAAHLEVRISEFTVAPEVNPKDGGLPYHEWFIEFEKEPDNSDAFAQALDQSIQDQNVYYKDLIEGKVLRSAVVSPLEKGAFESYMKSQGKLGGQNKVKRLSNGRDVAEQLTPYLVTS
jgi:hypothetical protein